MVVEDVLNDVVEDEEQDTAGKPVTSTNPDQYSVDCDIEQGIRVPSPGAQGDGNTIFEITIGTSNTHPSHNDESPRNFHINLKRALKDSFWSCLSFAPVLIAFNLILDLNKDAYFIWNNFFGWLLFAMASMLICLVVWGFVYGVFVVPMGRWFFPRWCRNEAVEVESEERVADNREWLS